jgi:hypothetical protein
MPPIRIELPLLEFTKFLIFSKAGIHQTLFQFLIFSKARIHQTLFQFLIVSKAGIHQTDSVFNKNNLQQKLGTKATDK